MRNRNAVSTKVSPPAEPGAYLITSYVASIGTVVNGDTVTVQQTGSAVGNTLTTATLTIGTISFTPNTLAVSGSTSAARTFALTNTGNATLTISGITSANSVFGVTHNCGSSPASATTTSSSILIASNATGSPHSVNVSGTGIASNAPVCTLTATPSTVRKNGTSVLTSSCTNTPTSYSWTGGTCAGTTAATCTVTPSLTTTYGITATNGSGSGSASATVTVTSGDITPILFLLLFD